MLCGIKTTRMHNVVLCRLRVWTPGEAPRTRRLQMFSGKISHCATTGRMSILSALATLKHAKSKSRNNKLAGARQRQPLMFDGDPQTPALPPTSEGSAYRLAIAPRVLSAGAGCRVQRLVTHVTCTNAQLGPRASDLDGLRQAEPIY